MPVAEIVWNVDPYWVLEKQPVAGKVANGLPVFG
jgi:hypothetical protein